MNDVAQDIQARRCALAVGRAGIENGSAHEALKNFPTRDQALGWLGARATLANWTEHPHDWVLSYTLT
jgi:hypothetical protein